MMMMMMMMMMKCHESDNRSSSTADSERSKQVSAMASNSSSSNLSGLRNKIKIRLSSASSTVDMTSPCVERPVPQSSTVVDQQHAAATSRATAAARNLTFNFSRRARHAVGGATTPLRRPVAEPLTVVQSTHLTLVDFVDLFRSFMLHARKDLRDLFDQQLATAASASAEFLTPSAVVGGGGPGTGVGSGAAAAASFLSFPSDSKFSRYICELIMRTRSDMT